MIEEALQFQAQDGVPLTGTWFDCGLERAPTVLIASATGIKRGYYAKFARFLQQSGFHVFTFDYRGIGDSLQGKPGKSEAVMGAWGTLDLPAAIEWLKTKKPDAPMLMVGHSVAGQILGLAPNAGQLQAIYLVASQSGYWRLWPGFDKWKVWLFWYIGIPLLTRLWGYLPGWSLGNSENLPAGVAREWARWGKHPDYVLSHEPDVKERFADIKAPLALISFTDDFFGPIAAAEILLGWYGSREKHRRIISPNDLGVHSVGHFGFFRDRFKQPLWNDALQWLKRQVPAAS